MTALAKVQVSTAHFGVSTLLSVVVGVYLCINLLGSGLGA